MWKGNDAGREEGEEKRSRPATEIRLACLPSFYMDPPIYVSGAGSNTFSELVLISCHTWRKGGGEEEADMRSLDSTVCVGCAALASACLNMLVLGCKQPAQENPTNMPLLFLRRFLLPSCSSIADSHLATHLLFVWLSLVASLF